MFQEHSYCPIERGVWSSCMQVCTYICMYVCMYVCMCKSHVLNQDYFMLWAWCTERHNTHTNTQTVTNAHTQIHKHTQIHTHTHTHTHDHTHDHTHNHTQTQTHTHTHTHTQTHTHTHTGMCMCDYMRLCLNHLESDKFCLFWMAWGIIRTNATVRQNCAMKCEAYFC